MHVLYLKYGSKIHETYKNARTLSIYHITCFSQMGNTGLGDWQRDAIDGEGMTPMVIELYDVGFVAYGRYLFKDENQANSGEFMEE